MAAAGPGSLPSGGPRGRLLYGRRKGRPLSAAKRRLMDELLPRLALDLEGAAPAALDPRSLFTEPVFSTTAPRALPHEVWLEVGFGAGEHLCAQARAHPGIGLIGCEPFVSGLAAALSRIEAERSENIRLFADDARLVLDALEDASLSRVFVLFPDPWPKARHAKRRFIARDTLDQLARVMAPGAELRLASDDRGYVRWALAACLAHPAFAWTAEGPADWRARAPDQPATRYEEKARERGNPPVFLTFRRGRGR